MLTALTVAEKQCPYILTGKQKFLSMQKTRWDIVGVGTTILQNKITSTISTAENNEVIQDNSNRKMHHEKPYFLKECSHKFLFIVNLNQ